MSRRPDIGFWTVLAAGGVGFAACLASVVVDGRLGALLISVGLLILFPAMTFLASRTSGRPLREPEYAKEKRRPIMEAVMQLGLCLLWLGQLFLPNGFMAHVSFAHITWVGVAVAALCALGILLSAYRLIRAIIGRLKTRPSAA